MAASPKTPLPSLCLLLAIFAILVVHSNQIASPPPSKPQEVEKACAETLEPEVCKQCLKSGKTTPSNDIMGLINSLLNCMLLEATKARDIALVQASHASTPPSLKGTLMQCWDDLKETVNQVQTALFTFGLGHYTEAWNNTNTARRLEYRCALAFHGNADFAIPTDLVNSMVRARRLCDATYVLFVVIV